MKLVIIFGPPAVGKMTVGYELQKLTGLKLFHNHMTIDLVLRFFDFGSPHFGRLVKEFRRLIFEEVAASDLPGMIFTFVWALDLAEDREYVDEMCRPFRERGAEIYYVELAADIDERLRRNETEFRLAEKAPKRDIEQAKRNLLESEERYQMNTKGDFFYPERHLRIDNTKLEPDVVARQIADWMDSLQDAVKVP